VRFVSQEEIELQAKLLNYFLERNKSNINQFDLTKGLLFETFLISVWYKLYRCDHSVLELESFSPPMNL